MVNRANARSQEVLTTSVVIFFVFFIVEVVIAVAESVFVEFLTADITVIFDVVIIFEIRHGNTPLLEERGKGKV
jgi:hypothetical protein